MVKSNPSTQWDGTMRSLATFLALFFVSSGFGQPTPTRCQTSPVTVSYDSSGARLLGACDGSFPDDVLWNLDRSDQVNGVLDGRFNALNDRTGSVVYVVDSGTLASHDEFMKCRRRESRATPRSRRRFGP